MPKRKTKRRPQHRPIYYTRKLDERPDERTILELVREAALQPKRLISDEEYTSIYWQARALLNEKGVF